MNAMKRPNGAILGKAPSDSGNNFLLYRMTRVFYVISCIKAIAFLKDLSALKELMISVTDADS
jgi:hypothetical protein